MQSNTILHQLELPASAAIQQPNAANSALPVLASVPEEEHVSVGVIKKPKMTNKRQAVMHPAKFVTPSTVSTIPTTSGTVLDDSVVNKEKVSAVKSQVVPPVTDSLATVAKPPVRLPPPIPQKSTSVKTNNPFLSDEQKRDAFVKAYRALREAQSGFFKTDWVKDNNIEKMHPQDALTLILKHSQKAGSRTNKAWEIVQNHQGTFTNAALNEIYRYSFQHSGFFKRSCAAGKVIYRNKTLQQQLSTIDFSQSQPEGSRRQKIAKMTR